MFSTLFALSCSVLLNLAHTTSAQQATLLASNLPACAQQCPVLLQAQAGCVPPAAPVTDQAIYQSCFCQSALLTQLPTSNICAPQCSAEDIGTIQAWFNGLCAQGAPVATPNPIPTTPATTISATNLGATNTAVSTATAVPGSTSSSGSQQGWFASHWRWVVMLIVLFIGFIVIAVVGRFLHRRYHRRRALAARGVGAQPDLGTWAPHGQSVHEFGEFGPGVGVRGEKGKGKGKGKENAQATTQQHGKAPWRGSKKLKKGG